MYIFRNSRNLSMVVLLCLFVQMLALMPHHHHGSDETPCFNPIHCVMPDGACSDENGCAGHGDYAPETTCSMKVDPAELGGTHSHRAISVVLDLPATQPTQLLSLSDEAENPALCTHSVRRCRHVLRAVSICVDYLVIAHPFRAPNLLA